MTGPPGVGKGMVIGEIEKIIHHPKLQRIQDLAERRIRGLEELCGGPEAMQVGFVQKQANGSTLSNQLIPLAPNATTFESLTRTMTEATRLYKFKKNDGKEKKEFHSSIYFKLEELGSLFKKHTEEIHIFLNETYDCKDKFEYKTKNHGHDEIINPCTNILAGTTPDFLRRVFASQILTEGFASRTSFVVCMKNRSRHYDTPSFCDEQRMEREMIIDHIRKLTQLSGLCTWSPDAKAFNKQWYEVDYAKAYPNPNPKLEPYYARINLTHAKVAAAMHYLESIEPVIQLETAQRALKFCQLTEQTMHLALKVDTANPLSQVTEDVVKFIKANGSTHRKTLLANFYESLPDPYTDIDKIINYLKDTGSIKDCDSGKPNTYTLTDK